MTDETPKTPERRQPMPVAYLPPTDEELEEMIAGRLTVAEWTASREPIPFEEGDEPTEHDLYDDLAS